MANLLLDISTLFKRITENDDQAAFELLFNQEYRILCSFAMRFLNDQGLVEEAVSEVFVKLWLKRKEISISESHKSYLFTCVRNQSIDLLRKSENKNRNFIQYDLDIVNKDYTPDEAVEFQELTERISNGIDTLPKHCKKIFLLSREEQYSYQEIADQLGISLKTVKTQMYRAVKKIRSYMNNNIGSILLFFKR